jgi:hypothetical protein
VAASRTKAVTLAGSPAYHPPGAVDRLAVLRAQQADLAEKRADNAVTSMKHLIGPSRSMWPAT